MKTIHLIIVAFLLIGSCKKGPGNDERSDLSENDLENVLDENLKGMMEGEDQTELQKQISMDAISQMVENGQMTQAEADKIIANMEKIFKNMEGGGFDAESYGDSISNALGGLEAMLNNENDNAVSTQGNAFAIKPFQSEKDRGMQNMRDLLKIDNTQHIEEIVRGWFGFSRQKRKLLTRKLASETLTVEKMDEAMLEFFEVSPEELELIKMLPASESITSESQSIAARDYELPEGATRILKSGKASEGFKAVIERFNYNRGATARRILPKAKEARKAFYDLNPGWYGSDEKSGDTYLDSHRNYIHLPLGKLSFADRVVSHELQMENGFYPEGAVGPPDLTKEVFTGANPKICNLGTRGVLTLEFTDNAIADVNGPDLYVFEMGAIEPTNLEISKDGKTWINVGKIEGGTAMVDIAEFVKPKETFNYIRLTDLVTQSTLPGADVDAVAAIGGALRLNLDSSVLFDFGKYTLKESASETLKKLVSDIEEMPKGTIIIEGHTDNVGDPNSNLSLSENRAKEVMNYLKKHISSQYKIQTKGFGETQPVAPNDTEENKQKNRRVEILVLPTI